MRKKIHECLQATPTKPRELLKTNYKSFTLTCSTKILPCSCRLHRVFLDRVRQNRASQRKVHQPNEKCWKFDCCVTYFSGKVKCFLCNLTRDDKSEVSNPLFVFNMFSQICAQWLKIQDNYSPQKGLKLLFILFLRTSHFNLFRRSCWK